MYKYYLKLLCVEHILVHPVERLFNAGAGRGQIDAQMAGAVEHHAVLHGSTDGPAGFLHVLNGLAVGGAPVGAVHKEHIGAFGLCHMDTLEVLCDVVAGEIHIAGQRLTELVGPLIALGAVGTDEGVHREDVHGVIVAEGGFLLDAVTPPRVINDMIAADETGEVEGLGGGVEGGSAHPGVLTDGLGGDVLVAGEDDVRPDLVGYDVDIILFVQLHGLFQLPALPDAAAGVVGAAQDGGVDVLFGEVLFHVGVIHPPDAILVLHQRGVDDVIAVVGQAAGEADVGGAVDQHLVAPGADAVQCADDAAQHTVLVTDGLGGQTRDVVASLLPADDGAVVFGRRVKITESRVLDPLDDGLLDGGQADKVHVCHPHGDGIEAGLRCVGRKAFAQPVHGDGVPAMAVGQGGEIVLHGSSSCGCKKGFPQRESHRCRKSALDELDGLHLDGGLGLVVPVGGDGCDLVHDVHAGDDLAESGVLAVQMGCVLVHDEELAAGAVGVHAAGHADDAADVLDGVVDAIGGKLALDVPAGAAGAVAQRAAALDHKAGDDTVEGQAVVKAFLDQLFEILTGDGGNFLVQLDVDDAAVFHSNANHNATILLLC